jgi:hypothetical protein
MIYNYLKDTIDIWGYLFWDTIKIEFLIIYYLIYEIWF